MIKGMNGWMVLEHSSKYSSGPCSEILPSSDSFCRVINMYNGWESILLLHKATNNAVLLQYIIFYCKDGLLGE